jgi:hypothetical protein
MASSAAAGSGDISGIFFRRVAIFFSWIADEGASGSIIGKKRP